MKTLVQIAGAAMALVLASQSGVASAQNIRGTPYFGQVTLNGGFTPDPYTVDISAGGSIEASRVRSSCRGRVGDSPDFRLNYRTSGSNRLPLYIRAISQDGRDITLLVNAANGSWHCDDDSLGDLNPQVVFDNPASGQYEIWVGTFSGERLSNARLEISELPFENNNGGGRGRSGSGLSSVLELSATPISGSYSLRAGFRPDPRRYSVTSGGSVRANDSDSRCSGYVSRSPDLRLNYTAGSLPLVFRTSASHDTTLIINDSNGNWWCDDDSGEGLNAKVVLNNPQGGQYDVWIGSYDGDSRPAILEVSEIDN